jgi:hypothetical protein
MWTAPACSPSLIDTNLTSAGFVHSAQRKKMLEVRGEHVRMTEFLIFLEAFPLCPSDFVHIPS